MKLSYLRLIQLSDLKKTKNLIQLSFHLFLIAVAFSNFSGASFCT